MMFQQNTYNQLAESLREHVRNADVFRSYAPRTGSLFTLIFQKRIPFPCRRLPMLKDTPIRWIYDKD